MTPAQLSDTVLRSVRDVLGVAAGPDWVRLRRPPRGHGRAGEWATGVALRAARVAGRPAGEVAELLRERLLSAPGVRRVEVRGGGFLNITLGEGCDAALLAELAGLDAAGKDGAPGAAAGGRLPEDPARDAAAWAAVAGGDPGGELLVQRVENPLFRMRYAHARARALLRWGAAFGIAPEPGAAPFTRVAERALLDLLGERPVSREPVGVAEGQRQAPDGPAGRARGGSVAAAGPGRGRAGRGEGARLARWLVAVAGAFLEVEATRSALPVGEEKPGAVHRARLALAQATGAVLADGLTRLGISAPDHL